MIRWMLGKLHYCMKCYEAGRWMKMKFVFVQYPYSHFYRCPWCNHYEWR